MQCSVSYALGHWRGFWGKARHVQLCPRICWVSYEQGHREGRAFRTERDRVRAEAL